MSHDGGPEGGGSYGSGAPTPPPPRRRRSALWTVLPVLLIFVLGLVLILLGSASSSRDSSDQSSTGAGQIDSDGNGRWSPSPIDPGTGSGNHPGAGQAGQPGRGNGNFPGPNVGSGSDVEPPSALEPDTGSSSVEDYSSPPLTEAQKQADAAARKRADAAARQAQADENRQLSEYKKYQNECKTGTDGWRSGEVRFPQDLGLTVDGATTYVATIDIRRVRTIPAKTIPGTPTSGEIFVQCTVAARLIIVGDAVKPPPDEWTPRSFTPSGVVDWSWTLQGNAVRDGQVRLEFVPALAGKDGSITPLEQASDQLTSYTTSVHVDGTLAQTVWQWIQDNQAAAVGIGAVLIGLIAFSRQILAAIRGLVGDVRGEANEEDSTDLPPEPQPTKPGRKSSAGKKQRAKTARAKKKAESQKSG